MDGIADISPMARACSITQTYASSDTFFALIPQSYRQYYFNVVRPLQQFYDGYVYGLHTTEGGVFSTRLYPSLCDGLANKVVGSKARFKAGSGEKDMSAIDKQKAAEYEKLWYKGIQEYESFANKWGIPPQEWRAV